MTRHSLAATAMALVLAAPLAAQDTTDPMIDTDGDGTYSLAEMQAVFADFTEEDFAVIDTDGDGLLGPEEIAAATEVGLMPAIEG